MKNISLIFCSMFFLSHFFFTACNAQSSEEGPTVNLELTYPAGISPRVFTCGWVFGAKAVVNPGTPDARDISEQVLWSGSGIFMPSMGMINRPLFSKPGINTINLTVTVDSKQFQKTYNVDAVDPYNEKGERIYAVLSDQTYCSSDTHGCPSCPHSVMGKIITGSPNVSLRAFQDTSSNSFPAARVGDHGAHAACCGPNTFEIIEGDPNILIDGRPAARFGDRTKHCGGYGKISRFDMTKFYVIFQPHIPELKEEKKLKRRDNESQQEWMQRKKEAYQNLAFNDFNFKNVPLEKSPFIIAFGDQALGKYTMSEFSSIPQWTMKINISSKIAGVILLTSRGVYNTRDELMAAYPFLNNKKDSKEFVICREDGTGIIPTEKETINIGPFTANWTEQDQQQSVQFVKNFMMLFDCFVTNVTYGTRDIQKINIFREFRDKVLLHTPEGVHLTQLYEEHGLDFAIKLRRHPGYLSVVRFSLDVIAVLICISDTENDSNRILINKLVSAADQIARIFIKEKSTNNESTSTKLIRTFF